MGCGKSKQAVAIVENTAVLSRKKSSSRSKSLRDVERNHDVTAGTNENNSTDNDNGSKASEVKQKENENGGNSSTGPSQNKSDGGPKDLKDYMSNGNDGVGKNDSINTSNNGNVASGVKQKEKENANGSSDAYASGGDVKSDIEANIEVEQEESREGKESNKSEEVIGLDNGDKKKQEVTLITHEKTENEGKSDEKFESDTPSHEAPKEDSVAENVEVDDAIVEEENNGGENNEEIANEDVGMKNEIKEEQTPETDVNPSTREEKAADKPQPESSSSIEDADTN